MIDPVAFSVEHKHEQVVSYFDDETGLRAFIALHNTRRGPAVGGSRLWHYDSPQDALLDVLRLSEGMTYKAALAGLPLGGGKTVILADGNEQDASLRAARFRVLGRYIEALGGRYITAEDVGTTPEDMAQARRSTRFVMGTPIEEGGSGDPSPMTAFGVLCGMRALVEDVLGRDTLAGVRVAIQGLGKVGMGLAELLAREGAAVIGSDVRPQVVEEARNRLKIEVVEPQAIYDVPCEIFAPCAMGAVMNDRTIPRLACRIVAGSANNQLEEERHAEALHARAIVYAVDYVINSGGLINVASELDGYDENKARAQTAQIYYTIKRMLEIARAEGISTQRAAHRVALNILGNAAK
ncbi:MAG TPA: Glu/Leu/Phe/Val dehydrogenase dimerization domain-containing protein [Ktedonobacterales bacterium]|jgi:leucine dehydrogenase